MKDEREVAESPVTQGSQEVRPYSFSFAGSNLGTIQAGTARLEDLTVNPPVDVSAGKLMSTTGFVDNESQSVLTSLVSGLVPGHLYRLRCKATNVGGRTDELFCILVCDF